MRPPRLISVSGTAFGSFASPFEVKFPESGLVLLRGWNVDTGGGSASGKSTLIHAINYPGGTCPVPLTALQSWYTKETPRVTATYDVDGKIVKITRGKRFLLEIDGQPFNGSADSKEEKIDALFGTSAEMRLALTYRGQRKPGLFLSKTDKKQKEFLTKLLNLEKWDEEQKKSVAKVKELEDRYTILIARLQDNAARLESLRAFGDGAEVEASYETLVAEIKEHEAAQGKYQKTVKDLNHDAEIVHQFALDLFKPKMEAATELVQKLERATITKPAMTPEWERLKSLQSTIQMRLDRLCDEDINRLKDMVAQAEQLRSEWAALALQAAGEQKLLADRDRVVADIQELVKNVCPTCKREWDEAAASLEDLKVELEQINAEVQDLKWIKEQAAELRAQYDAMPKTVEPNPLIAQMKLALDKCKRDVAAEEQTSTASANAAIEQLNTDIRAARKAKEELSYEMYNVAGKKRDEVLAGVKELEALALAEKDLKVRKELARQKLAEEVGAIRYRRQQIAECEVIDRNLTEQLAPLQAELAREKDFAHLSGREGFRGSVFDEALDAISEEANAMLASIANTRNCTIQFESENETQEGKLRQEITPQIYINGHKAHSLDWGPSGGMLSAIELAVDLAVGKIIAERTGVCPGWLILDESFDGLGAREKDTCLEMLQLHASDRLVIIVDHTSETQGFFTKRITVTSNGGVSTIGT